MSAITIDAYIVLSSYVGKVFYIDYNEVMITCLLGGAAGHPFFLCKWQGSDSVYCAEPLDVLPHFDDNGEPIRDFHFE